MVCPARFRDNFLYWICARATTWDSGVPATHSICEDNEAGDFIDTVRHAIQAFREAGFEPNNHVVVRGGFDKSILDTKYPHKCFKCGEELQFRELLDRNAIIYHSNTMFYEYEKYKHLKKLWKSPYVKLYCCSCYDEKFKKDSKELFPFNGFTFYNNI